MLQYEKELPLSCYTGTSEIQTILDYFGHLHHCNASIKISSNISFASGFWVTSSDLTASSELCDNGLLSTRLHRVLNDQNVLNVSETQYRQLSVEIIHPVLKISQKNCKETTYCTLRELNKYQEG